MKNIKLIFTLLAIVLLVPSCENDGGDSKIDTQNGAVPNVQKVEDSEAFVNLVAVNNGDPINLQFTIGVGEGEELVQSMDVLLFYYKTDGSVYKGTLDNDVTSFPKTYSISQADLFDVFDELNSAADIEVGDQLLVTTNVTLKDGTNIQMVNDDGSNNFSPNIANSSFYDVIQTYNVACESDLGGTYNYTTTNASAPTGEFAAGPLTGTTTLTDNGGGVYSIDDASFGGWIGLYGPGNVATGVTFTDVCGQLSYTDADQFGEIFTLSNLVVNGSELSFHWENDYGEFGDTTLTRTDGTDWPPLHL
ncbi:MAG: hypothetical protein CFE23_03825 [Flavobacterium sp. BFFFF1]|uniref:hypothetical protein n=1 Tax=unclassified Flavobacterium TaxID=196869 RepID=UPI000BCC5EF8|nr:MULTISPECIES: hypothetical protein [unclassified Flavobacterium]OYU81609.1 MAG: hypothetical protein CFE23_03825 [Flavobacterium sp. BFFFF1]